MANGVGSVGQIQGNLTTANANLYGQALGQGAAKIGIRADKLV
jgi:hypothetical protein